jgi:hypothetical protein
MVVVMVVDGHRRVGDRRRGRRAGRRGRRATGAQHRQRRDHQGPAAITSTISFLLFMFPLKDSLHLPRNPDYMALSPFFYLLQYEKARGGTTP